MSTLKGVNIQWAYNATFAFLQLFDHPHRMLVELSIAESGHGALQSVSSVGLYSKYFKSNISALTKLSCKSFMFIHFILPSLAFNKCYQNCVDLYTREGKAERSGKVKY